MGVEPTSRDLRVARLAIRPGPLEAGEGSAILSPAASAEAEFPHKGWWAACLRHAICGIDSG